MVGPRPSSAAAAAAEERQRKLQEYLAAKGKLKNQNTKPYLKARNNCLNPPPSKSTIGPQRHVTKHAVLSDKATRPISTKLQSRPTNIRESQKPKSEPPNLLGKRLTSKCVSSNPNCKPSSKSHQQCKTGSSTTGDLSRKPTKSPNTQEQQITTQGIAPCADHVDGTQVENESGDGFLKEMNKENLSHTLSEPEKKTNPELCTISKPKINTHNQTKSSLAPQQVLGKSLVNCAILKDRVNKQFVRKPHINTVPLKSQQLSKGAHLTRPGEKPPRTVPSHLMQTLGRTPASEKPAVKDIKSVTAERGKYMQSCSVTGQEARRAKPRTYPNWHQGELNHRHPSTKQDRKSMQPYSGPQMSCGLRNTRALSQKPNMATGRYNSVVSNTPSIEANGTNSNKHKNFQQKVQTVDSKLKKAFPQSHFLNKTAPKTQAGITTIKGRGVPRGAQTNPNTKKVTAEDRRKQLEEWQKSKGKIYKRPPMELKTKRKIIEKMNISFWKSIEKEEEERKAQWELSSKINNTLTECLRLIEEGVHSSEILAILSSIPEAEKFAKFWICKAKLLASQGTFDVIGLYEEAISNGATPLQELREVVLNILQESARTTEGISSDALVAETNITSVEELVSKMDSGQSCSSAEERDQATATPAKTRAGQHSHAGIKLQITPIPRINGMPEVQDMKLITPVRRSARIERAVSRYPEMLQEHNLVVASLDELLEVEETECFIFRNNEALSMMLASEMLDT